MYLATEAGEMVSTGAMLTAVAGPHLGRHFRFCAIHEDRERIHVHHVYAHPFRNARAVLHPSVFGLRLQEEISRLRHLLNLCCHALDQLWSGVFMGVIALVPLAFFEQYQGAEHVTAIVNYFVGGE